jgi:hypothetical protein
MNRSRFVSPFLVAGAALSLGSCAAPSVSPPPAAASTATAPAASPGPAVAPITAEAMHARIYFLAADALRGRDTPSPELEVAAAYLASEAKRIGLQPAGEGGTFYQRWPYSLFQLSATGVGFDVAGPRGPLSLRLGRDFYPSGGIGEPVEGGLVFVGQRLPDGPEAEGALRDRIAVFALPGVGDRNWRMLREAQLAAAERGGARAVVHVLDPRFSEAQIAQSAQAAGRPGRVIGEPSRVTQFHLAYPAAARIFAAADLNLDQSWRQAAAGTIQAVALPGLTGRAAAPRELLQRADPPNVVAVLPGRDPALRAEHIILSAHFDHVGVGTPMNGDSIYNGADDNASGTAALLEVARALLALPEAERPRRSVAFLWVSGEEKGLLGSRWFADNPTIPIEQLVANFNLDMIAGDQHRDSVIVIGKDYSTLGAAVDRVNARLPQLRLIASDDIWPEQQFFFRSDQLNFMRKEIPALFFFTGVHRCYHRPCDTVDFVDTHKAARVANLVFHTVREIADAPERPRWDPAGLAEVRRITR